MFENEGETSALQLAEEVELQATKLSELVILQVEGEVPAE
jgi:hypothetical protein